MENETAKKPGPKPDPTKTRSRHNPDNPGRLRPKKERVPRTHCKVGHELTDENTYVNNGTRSCKACRRAATYKSRKGSYGNTGNGQGSNNSAKTECPKGHTYTPENTYTWNG